MRLKIRCDGEYEKLYGHSANAPRRRVVAMYRHRWTVAPET